MKKTSPLRILRITLALVFFIGITLLFMGIGQQWWGWMAKLQFLPSCLALNLGVIAGIVILTLLFGRIYCSVICPMGVLQDIVIWLRRQHGLMVNKIRVRRGMVSKEQKTSVKHFAFSPERKIIRYGMLVLTIVALIAGIQVFIALIAPYSSYGRIVRGITGIGDGAPAALIITAFVTLLVITACAVLGGRIWCNTICPVGTVLGLFGRKPVFRPHIDTEKCNNCGRCVRGCKSSCIDGENHIIDYSRCVVCFDCVGRCKQGAISFSHPKGDKDTSADSEASQTDGKDSKAEEGGDVSRRNFIAIGAFLAGSTALKAADGGLAPVIDKQKPERTERLVPPGAGSVDSFYNHCTACQLCVSACPNHVLRPSTDLEHFLQPEMSYEKGYCRPECTACSDICPTGAISKLLEGQKLGISIGVAQVNPELCIINRDDVDCGNCARHCPVGAVRMVEKEGSAHKIPAVSEDICIGCGACENLCPSRPISAITVNGRSTHNVK